MSSSSSSSSSGTSASPGPLLHRAHPLPRKAAGVERRARADLLHISRHAAVVVDVPSGSPAEAVLSLLLHALVSAGQLSAGSVAECLRALYDVAHGEFRARLATPRYTLATGRVPALDHHDRPLVALARVQHAAWLGVVLGGRRRVKRVRDVVEVARSIAAALEWGEMQQHEMSEEGVRKMIRRYVEEAREEAVQEEQEDWERSGKLAGGLRKDVRRRWKWETWKSDWVDGWTDGRSVLKYLSTVVWLYFAIIMPTIAFGALNDENTAGGIGVIETIISQAFAGVVFAVAAGQPLTIVMTTAPLTVFIEILVRWCASLGIEFLPFYAWTGIWTAVILLVLVVVDACSVMKFVGSFTEEIFAMLIAALFVAEYVKPLIHVFEKDTDETFLLAFVLATGTFLIAQTLLGFRRSFLLKPILNQLLADFGVPLAIVIMTAVRQVFPEIELESLKVPEEIGIVTTSGRNWLVPFLRLPIQYVFLAMISGMLLATLFFLDQNISSMLVNKPWNKLEKGSGYYLDLVIVAFIVIIQSLLGLPWTHAALPHSPLHARQLADVEEFEVDGRKHERVIMARETRITGLLTHVLIGLSILLKDALGWIPMAVLYGFFLELGIETLNGNALWDRILLVFTQGDRYPANHYVRRVRKSRIHVYTLIQVACLVVLWMIKSNLYMGDTLFNTGLLFPLIIALFVPLRLYVLPKIFTKPELTALATETNEHEHDAHHV